MCESEATKFLTVQSCTHKRRGKHCNLAVVVSHRYRRPLIYRQEGEWRDILAYQDVPPFTLLAVNQWSSLCK